MTQPLADSVQGERSGMPLECPTPVLCVCFLTRWAALRGMHFKQEATEETELELFLCFLG